MPIDNTSDVISQTISSLLLFFLFIPHLQTQLTTLFVNHNRINKTRWNTLETELSVLMHSLLCVSISKDELASQVSVSFEI